MILKDLCGPQLPLPHHFRGGLSCAAGRRSPFPLLPVEVEVVEAAGGPQAPGEMGGWRRAPELPSAVPWVPPHHSAMVRPPQVSAGAVSIMPIASGALGSGAKTSTWGSWCQEAAEVRGTLPTPPTWSFYNQTLLIYKSWGFSLCFLPPPPPLPGPDVHQSWSTSWDPTQSQGSQGWTSGRGACSLLTLPFCRDFSSFTKDMQTEEMVLIPSLHSAHTLQSSQTVAFWFSLWLNVGNVVCIFQKGHVVYLIYESKEERKSLLDSFWFSILYKCENWGSTVPCLPMIISQMSVYMLLKNKIL